MAGDRYLDMDLMMLILNDHGVKCNIEWVHGRLDSGGL
jgi:hypothetical protein